MTIGARSSAWISLLFPLAGMLPKAMATTCGEVKTVWMDGQCCGSPDRTVTLPTSIAPSCPYDFSKPACSVAEPQSPRDLTPGALGDKTPKAATLTDEQANFLPLVNVHWHYGAEHKSEEYSIDADSVAYDELHPDGRRLASDPRPGFMCSEADLTSAQKLPYTFQHCKGNVQVGKSYEVHYVHSSAGQSSADMDSSSEDIADVIGDGLGAAANGRGQLNPMIVVQGQVFQVVQGADTVNDMLHGWTVVSHLNSVMYPGSTTGPSHNNEVCSPYAITWHVDTQCHRVTPESFDNLCKQLKDVYNLTADLYPHGSRKLVDKRWVVTSEYVLPLTR